MPAYWRMVGFLFCFDVWQEPLIGGESSSWWAISEETMQQGRYSPAVLGELLCVEPNHHPPKCEESEKWSMWSYTWWAWKNSVWFSSNSWTERFKRLAVLESCQLNKDQSCLQYLLWASARQCLETAWFPSTMLLPFHFLPLLYSLLYSSLVTCEYCFFSRWNFYFSPLAWIFYICITNRWDFDMKREQALCRGGRERRDGDG